ncbi:MAG: DKNYY domain-containing protein [Bacteroidota bacterium]
MKTILKILFAPVMWLVQACSPLGKPVDPELSDSFYYNKSKTDVIYSSMGNWFELGKTSLGADAESFLVFNTHIGMDKHHAYYQWLKIKHPDLDLKSFHAKSASWMWHVGLDDRHVYVFDRDIRDGAYELTTNVIEKANPDSYVKLDMNWAKDDQSHFYQDEWIDVDYASFQPINEYFASDKNRVYVYFQDLFEPIAADVSSFQKVDERYVRDASHVFFFLDYLRREEVRELIRLPYSNENTLKFHDENHVSVEHQVYYRGQLIDDINPDKLVTISSEYIKDDLHVYYQGRVVENADPNTFRYDESTFSYRDKNHQYREGQVWRKEDEEANILPATQTEDMQTKAVPDHPLQVIIELNQETYQVNEPVALSMSVENVSDATASFCTYHTPFEGIQNNIFTVYRGKDEIPYQGKMRKRMSPTEKDHTSLKPGKTSTCSITLEGYDIHEKGMYTLQFSGNTISGLPASNTAQFYVE